MMMQASADTYTSFTVSNTMGQVILQRTINADVTKVNVSMLPSGIYYISIKGQNGVEVRKFVKM